MQKIKIEFANEETSHPFIWIVVRKWFTKYFRGTKQIFPNDEKTPPAQT